MTNKEAIVALNMVNEIGSARLAKLLKFFATAQEILRAPEHRLIASGLNEKTAAKIRAIKNQDVEREFNLAKRLGLNILIQDDPEYPQILKQISSPPLALYVKGEIIEQDESALAIVGSRLASFSGLSLAEKFAADLAVRGITIISGLARGVDTAAHQGALKVNGRTIAVMGSGFNQLYPVENKKVAEEISENGAVISEFCLDEKPLNYNFPRRNRIVSGLSRGVVVVEAAQNSGALITADFALEQGRDVFALPGKIDARNSAGTNQLIKQGAKLVTCVEDILDEYNFKASAHPAVKNRIKNAIDANLNQGESALYDLISNQPVSLDEIAEGLNLDILQIFPMLLKLQVKKLIKPIAGKQYIRN